MRFPPIALATVVLAVLAPVAAAAPLSGEVWAATPIELHAPASLRVDEGWLDLSDAVDGVSISWAAAHGTIHTWEGRQGPANIRVGDSSPPKTLTWGAGRLDALVCRAPCRLALFVDARDGWVGLEGIAAGMLAPSEGREPRRDGLQGASSNASVSWHLPARWFEAGADADLLVHSAEPTAGGHARLVIFNVSGVRHDGKQQFDFDSGWQREPIADPIPLENARSASYTIELTDVRIHGPPSQHARLAGPDMELTLDGRVRTERADGWIVLGGARHQIDGETLDATGALHLHVRVASAGSGPTTDPRDVVSERSAFPLAGDASRVVIGGRVLQAGSQLGVPASTATIAGIAGLLAVAWLIVQSGILAPFYSRITRAHVLSHPTRAAIYARIREQPGEHVAALARANDVGRVVLQHHLRMLAAHGLIVARPSGRMVAWYPADGVPDARELAPRHALRDATRRRVALAVASTPSGATQRDVAEATGLSQRLVSYHLAHLEQTGLVRGVGARPRRFEATSHLEAEIATNESVALNAAGA